MTLGRIAVRTTVGGYFAAHGAQKLFGWFDGDGLDATGAMFESVGIRPGKLNATLAGVTEVGCGAALALGAATPLATTGLVATMVTAIRKVHFSNGPFIQQHGYEYNVVLIGALLMLAEDGPGLPGVDNAGRRLTRALPVLVAGLAGSLLAEVIARQVAGPVLAPAKNPGSTDASQPDADPDGDRIAV